MMAGKAGGAKVKRKAVAASVPQDRAAAVEAIAQMGRLTRARVRIETAMNDKVAVVKAAFAEQAAPIDLELRALVLGVQIYAEAHRSELTDGGKRKFVRLPSGEIKWRTNPPAVSVKGVDAVLERLRAAGLDKFIRIKEEINKEAILGDPAACANIEGITIVQDEEIEIAPYETVLEEVQ
jgi:phage host-nuclease inhibitor protein Gam